MLWEMQDARQKFSKLVKCALAEGPQTVTRHGDAVVVVVSIQEYRRLIGGKPDFKEFLTSGPDLSSLDLERTADVPREIAL